MLRHSLQRRSRADDEHRPEARPGIPTQHHPQANFNRSRAFLRLLRHLRFALESRHDPAEPSRVDEQDCRCRRYHWQLHGRNEGCMELLVCNRPTLAAGILTPFSLLRLLLGVVIAGMWPGMAYYLTLFYPPSRTGKRIGQYFTAAQVSAAVVSLVSAGFQKMDGLQGLVGFQWMFLLYGLVGICVGISLLWWLPDRPLPPGETPDRTGISKWIPKSRPALTGEDALIHYEDLTRVYRRPKWTLKDLWHVVTDWRVWPLFLMYFGVVGVGIGVQNYATVIIRGTNANLTGIELSLLAAPIWIVSRNSHVATGQLLTN